jgi:hypothetical protein
MFRDDGVHMTAHFPKPPFPAQKQSMPGSTAKMNPRPDHGEFSYKGSGKLLGKRAIITGGDSASAGLSPSLSPAKALIFLSPT